ncbi:MAG: hypothetical protein OJI67_22450 [Prosthecobacter sp.]|nr:hypothetical protein [Prosthecobacter sp.]
MFAKIIVTSALFLFGFVHSASAFDPSKPPSDEVINNTLQCEAGRVGQALARKGLPLNQKVAASWTISETVDSGWGLGFKIVIFDIGFDAGTTQQNLDEALSTGVPFNLHPDNAAVCSGYKIEIVKGGIGLRDCLVNKKATSLKNVLVGGSGTTGCHSKVTLGRKFSGSAKIPLWGPVTAGPSGSYAKTFVVDFTVVAPIRPK